MSDNSVDKLYERNALNGGMWVKVMGVLGYSQHISIKDFQQSLCELDVEQVIDKANTLVDWFHEHGEDGKGRQIAAQLILHYLDVKVVLQVIYSGNLTVENLLTEYLEQYPNKDMYLLMVEALLKGTWDRIPGESDIPEGIES